MYVYVIGRAKSFLQQEEHSENRSAHVLIPAVVGGTHMRSFLSRKARVKTKKVEEDSIVNEILMLFHPSNIFSFNTIWTFSGTCFYFTKHFF